MKDGALKETYRSAYKDIMPFIKMNYFIKRNKISQSAFSKFLKGPEYNFLISVDKLGAMWQDIIITLDNINL